MKSTIMAIITAITLSAAPYALADKKHSRHYDKQHFDIIDYARVIDAQPIYDTISYSEPVRECRIEERVVRHGHKSKTPVILGSIIGGAIGNELGHGRDNKKIGAVVGSILGGSIASDINREHHYNGRREVRHERVCTTVDKVSYREELVGYNVRYKYKGRVYHTTMANHPGDRIRVSVNIKPIDA